MVALAPRAQRRACARGRAHAGVRLFTPRRPEAFRLLVRSARLPYISCHKRGEAGGTGRSRLHAGAKPQDLQPDAAGRGTPVRAAATTTVLAVDDLLVGS